MWDYQLQGTCQGACRDLAERPVVVGMGHVPCLGVPVLDTGASVGGSLSPARGWVLPSAAPTESAQRLRQNLPARGFSHSRQREAPVPSRAPSHPAWGVSFSCWNSGCFLIKDHCRYFA